MPKLAVTDGAVLKCDMGSATSTLTVTTDPFIQIESALAATIFDYQPSANVKPFGVCAITGGPCVPVIPAPWMPGEAAILLAAMFPILPADSTLRCAVGGTIRIISPGQFSLLIDSLSESPSSLLVELVSALLSLFVELVTEPSPAYQYLHELIQSSGIREALKNAGNMTIDEKVILHYILGLPGARTHVKDLLQGAHFRIHDGGAVASTWSNLGSFYPRPSSHEGTLGAVDGPLTHTILFGVSGRSGRRYTWVQLERHPGKNPFHVWHPNVPFLPDPYFPVNPKDAVNEVGHLADKLQSDKTHNQGPYGKNKHTEHNDPINLYP
jgi:Domain of unknown function (DUF4280)